MTDSELKKLRERLYWIGDLLIMGSILCSITMASIYVSQRLMTECTTCNAFYIVTYADLLMMTLIIVSTFGIIGLLINYYASFNKRFKELD